MVDRPAGLTSFGDGHYRIAWKTENVSAGTCMRLSSTLVTGSRTTRWSPFDNRRIRAESGRPPPGGPLALVGSAGALHGEACARINATLALDRSATVFTLADSGYFVGAVALLNSLRLTGHHHRLVVLDCGLTGDQRARLSGHATVVRLSPELAARTVLAKPFMRELAPEDGVVLWLDADILVTGSLEPYVEGAAQGRICAHPVDRPDQRCRRFPEWAAIFGLTADLRQQVYVNDGCLALSLPRHRALLDRWWDACESIPTGAVFAGDIESPLWAGDQDALNALLMSELPAGELLLMPEGEAVFPPDVEDVHVIDRATLSCEVGGRTVRIVHYTWVPKPWAPMAWKRARRPLADAYRRLLPRALFEDDVALRVEPREVPLSLRPGLTGGAGRATIAVARPLRRSAAKVAAHLPVRARGSVIRHRDRLEPPER